MLIACLNSLGKAIKITENPGDFFQKLSDKLLKNNKNLLQVVFDENKKNSKIRASLLNLIGKNIIFFNKKKKI